MKDFSVRLLVTSKEAGILIGKDGSQIASLRESSHARISISKLVPKVNERIVQLSGSIDSILEALKLIVQAIIREKLTCKLLVAHQLAGAIIGRQGSRIQSIQEQSGVKIIISKDLLPQSTERLVEVTGTEAELNAGLKLVIDAIVEDAESAVGLIYYDPAKRPRRERKPIPEDGVSTTSKLAVPAELVGSIIGPGGKLINEIRNESGAAIHISPKEKNSQDRDVLITGSLEAISKALKLLHYYLEQEKERKQNE